MAYYRLYLVQSGRFVGFEEIDAVDDIEALRKAERRNLTHAVELWCGKRKVKSLAAQPQVRAEG
jgi:hypothetical protein